MCLLKGADKSVHARVHMCVIYSIHSYFDGYKCVERSLMCYFRLLIGVLFWVFIDVLFSMSAALLF